MIRSGRRGLVVALALSAAALGAAPAQRPISELDLFRFVWVADPEISPDGARIAFVRVTVDAKREGYDTSLWIVDSAGGTPRPLTAGHRDSGPRWSPDGRQLLFRRGTEDDG